MTPSELLRMSKRKRPRTTFTDLRLEAENELEPAPPAKSKRGLRNVRLGPRANTGRFDSSTEFHRSPDLDSPVPLSRDAASVSAHERDVARFRSEDAKTGVQTDEDPPTVVQKKRGLRNIRVRK